LTSGRISSGGAGSSDPFAGLPPSRGGTGQDISQPSAAADHELGQRLATWIGARGGQNFAMAPILSQVQDLLGADTSLQVPLRDLLQRPAFRSLFSGEAHSVQLGRRDALLADLAGTYTPALLGRLALVIDGCLGLPADPSSLPAVATAGSAAPPPRAAAAWAAPSPASIPASTPAWMSDPPAPASIPTYGNPTSQPPSQGYGRSAAPGAAFAPAAPGALPPTGGHPAARRGSSLTATLIVLLSLLVGGGVGLASILLLNRSPAPSTSSASPSRSSSPATPAAAPPAPTPAPPPKQPAPPEEGTPAGAWGGPSEYKFGRLPQGDYPDSCAFSRTDPAGQRTIDKSQLEYWACRDIGGDADRGYSVVWADGKQTTYTFRDDGSGAVVGTNGSTFAMSWRNDSHQGSNIIVISHQDGATTWIPGHVK
jgi:hypothetical protein